MDLKSIQEELKRAKGYADTLLSDIAQMKRQIAEQLAEISRLNKVLRQAKDARPVVRPSIKRVVKLVADACMDIQRVAGGWLLKFGKLTRRFCKLSEIWEIFTADNWYLSDVFPPVKEQSPPPAARPRTPFRAPVLAGKVGAEARRGNLPPADFLVSTA